MIDQLSGCLAIDLSLVCLNRVTVAAERGPILFRAWAALDRRVRRPRTDALRPRDCRLSPKIGRSIPIYLPRGRNTEPLSEVDIAPLREARFDLLLYFGCGVAGAEISACARLGTWSLQKGSLCGSETVPGQFWDMYEGDRVNQYGPQVVEQKQGQTRMVYRSSAITNFLSLALNENAAAWEIANFLVTHLSAVEGPRTGGQLVSETGADRPSIYPTLGNIRMAGFLVQWAALILRHELKRRLFREQWWIALQPKADMSEVKSGQGLRMLCPPRDRFYADPFLVDRDGRSYLFFEDYRFAAKKGVISCCDVDAEGNCGEPRVVLEREYHLSYPFLFTWQGEFYMIPETRDNRTIEVYRASAFPCSWVHEAVLMSGVEATDSTLLQYHDKWWLFTAGVLDHTSPNQYLFLFLADSPFGPWTASPKNPIVSDVGHARPAGCLYFDDGRLIRPGQDCSDGYGYAVQLHRVEVLSETAYHETLAGNVSPDWVRGKPGHTHGESEWRASSARLQIPHLAIELIFCAFQSTEN